MKHIKKAFICLIIMTMLFPGVDAALNTSYVTKTVQAHSGRTDSSGGHRDNKNKSGLGSYHYHCGGHPAHLHNNGVCPYDTASVTNKTSDDTGKVKITKSIIKKVQRELNDLGYDCGKVDGVAGKKTKKAVKAYQKDYGLSVDGIIGKELLGSLGIDY